MSDLNPNGGWHIDRRVPIAPLAMLALQTALFAFFFGQLTSRVNTLENTIAIVTPRGERLSAVETELRGLKSIMERMELKFDRRNRGFDTESRAAQ